MSGVGEWRDDGIAGRSAREGVWVLQEKEEAEEEKEAEKETEEIKEKIKKKREDYKTPTAQIDGTNDQTYPERSG